MNISKKAFLILLRKNVSTLKEKLPTAAQEKVWLCASIWTVTNGNLAQKP